MKKLNLILTLTMLLGVFLAGCASADNNANATPDLTEPVMGVSETPVDMVTEQPLTETPVATAEMPETPMATEEIQPTEVMTSTEMLPDTGFVDPGRVSNLIDFDVWNRSDEQIGTVEDMIFNIDQHRIDYVLVEVGGFLGIGGKLVAVPYDHFEVVTSAADSELAEGPQNAFILDVAREELENAPEFDREALPEPGQPAGDYDADITGYWETGMMTETTETETPVATEAITATETSESGLEAMASSWQGVILASDALGLDVQDSGGIDLATIEDMIVDPQSGEIRYLVIDAHGIEGMDGQWILVPVDVFSYDAESSVLIAIPSQDEFIAAPAFEAGNLPDTTAPDWDMDVDSYWIDLK